MTVTELELFMNSMKASATPRQRTEQKMVSVALQPFTKLLGPPVYEKEIPEDRLYPAVDLRAFNSAASSAMALGGFRGPLSNENIAQDLRDVMDVYGADSRNEYLKATFVDALRARTFDMRKMVDMVEVDWIETTTRRGIVTPGIAALSGRNGQAPPVSIAYNTRQWAIFPYNAYMEHNLLRMNDAEGQVEFLEKTAACAVRLRVRAHRLFISCINNDRDVKRGDLSPFEAGRHQTLKAALSEMNRMAFPVQKGYDYFKEDVSRMRDIIRLYGTSKAEPDTFLFPQGTKLLVGNDHEESIFARRGDRIRSILDQADDGVTTVLSSIRIVEIPDDNVHDRQATNRWDGTMAALKSMSGAALMRADDGNFDPANWETRFMEFDMLNMRTDGTFRVTVKDAILHSGMFLKSGELNTAVLRKVLEAPTTKDRDSLLAAEMMLFDNGDGSGRKWTIARFLGEILSPESLSRMVATALSKKDVRFGEDLIGGLSELEALHEELSNAPANDELWAYYYAKATRDAFEALDFESRGVVPGNQYGGRDLLPFVETAEGIRLGTDREIYGPDFTGYKGKFVPWGWSTVGDIYTIAHVSPKQAEFLSPGVVARAKQVARSLDRLVEILRDIDPKNPILVPDDGAGTVSAAWGIKTTNPHPAVLLGQLFLGPLSSDNTNSRGNADRLAPALRAGLGGLNPSITTHPTMMDHLLKGETGRTLEEWWNLLSGEGQDEQRVALLNAARGSVGRANLRDATKDQPNDAAIKVVIAGNTGVLGRTQPDKFFDETTWNLSPFGEGAGKVVFNRLHIKDANALMGFSGVATSKQAFDKLSAFGKVYEGDSSKADADRSVNTRSISRKMVRLFDDVRKSNLFKNNTQRAVAYFLMTMRNDLSSWLSLAEKNIYVPANFWIVRPSRRYIVKSGILMAAKKFGFFAVCPKYSFVSQTISTQHQNIKLKAEVMMGMVLTDPFSLARNNFFVCDSYRDGEDDTWYDAENPFQPEQADIRKRRSNMSIMMRPEYEPSAFCPLTGVYDAQTFQGATGFDMREEMNRVQRGSVLFYNILHNLDKLPPAELPNAIVPFNQDDRERLEHFVPNTWARRYDPATRGYTRVEPVNDKFGDQGSYPGCLAERCGKRFRNPHFINHRIVA